MEEQSHVEQSDWVWGILRPGGHYKLLVTFPRPFQSAFCSLATPSCWGTSIINFCWCHGGGVGGTRVDRWVYCVRRATINIYHYKYRGVPPLAGILHTTKKTWLKCLIEDADIVEHYNTLDFFFLSLVTICFIFLTLKPTHDGITTTKH